MMRRTDHDKQDIAREAARLRQSGMNQYLAYSTAKAIVDQKRRTRL